MKELLKRTAVLTMSVALAVSLLPAVPAQAAKKKLTVNKVYNTTTRVKGKTKGKYVVKIKIGEKSYKATANKKGNYSVKIPKQAAGKTLYVKAYKKGGKKYYTKKKFYVLAKTVSISKFSKTAKTIKGYARPKYTVKLTINGKTYTKKASSKKGYFSIKLKKVAGNGTVTIRLYNTKGKIIKSYSKKAYNAMEAPSTKVPGKMDMINENQVQKDIETVRKTGKAIRKNHIIEGKLNNSYYYNISKINGISYRIGYRFHYMNTEANGEWGKITSQNGITLYGCVSYTRNYDIVKEPTITDYDFKIASGQTKNFSYKDFKEDGSNSNQIIYKIKGYKDGKLVMMDCANLYVFGY